MQAQSVIVNLKLRVKELVIKVAAVYLRWMDEHEQAIK